MDQARRELSHLFRRAGFGSSPAELDFAAQMGFHSPTSQYGQLSRRGIYDGLDFAPLMREATRTITSGAFADEWEKEAESGYATLNSLLDRYVGPDIRTFEKEMRERLGPGVVDDGREAQ